MSSTKYIIYILTRNSDNLQYVGTTSEKSFRARMYAHTYHDRFSGDGFSVEILEESLDIKLLDKEEHYIVQYDTYHNGLNETVSGKGWGHNSPNFTTRGYKFSDESRKKMSMAQKGKSSWNKGKTGCYSEATLDHWRKVRKGRVFCTPTLSKKEVIEIRKSYDLKEFENDPEVGFKHKNGVVTSYLGHFCNVMAEKYNTTHQNIRSIIQRKTWKNV